MGQYCFARWRLLSLVNVCNAAGGQTNQSPSTWADSRCRARGQSGGRRCMAGQYSYVPLG